MTIFLNLISNDQGIVRYSQPETVHPSFVIIQAVYDTYDIMPVNAEAANSDDLSSQPDVRFVFIGIISLFKKSTDLLLFRLPWRIVFRQSYLFYILQVAIWSSIF